MLKSNDNASSDNDDNNDDDDDDNDANNNINANNNNIAALMSCVLIGNGTSAIERENGELINSFDEIVRFNSYQIVNYEKFVGRKTTDWFLVRHFSDQNFRIKNEYNLVAIHSWIWDEKKCRLWNEMKDKIKAKKLIKTEESVVCELGEFSNQKEYRAFSTGLIAIWMKLKRFERVAITGFDWQDTPPERHHYSNDGEARGVCHKPEIEYEIIEKLIQKNRIYRL